ncbi:MAG: DUF2007 domain-containing protein [Gammaproteobacteria bacterium]|nr:DUF2007 domain-containing protein [Gammaproteobacteria bacterium]
MKKVYSSEDRVLIYHLKNTLDLEGIDCFIKNDMAFTLAGEVPVNEVWPELWITDFKLQTKAEEIIKQAVNPVQSIFKSWQCPKCGEKHDSQFTTCWKCGMHNDLPA